MERLLLGIEECDLPPMSWTENGQLHGVLRDITDSLAEALEAEFEFVPMPQADMATAIAQDKLDLRFPDNPNWWHRSETNLFSLPVIRSHDAFYKLKGSSLTASPVLASLDYYDIPWHPKLEDIAGPAIRFRSLIELLNALLAGKVDIVYAPVYPLNLATYELDNYPVLEHITWLPETSTWFHFSFSQKRIDLLPKVNAWIQQRSNELRMWNGESLFKT